METRGFTYCTHGTGTRELVGNTALRYTPHVNHAIQEGGDPALTKEEISRFHEFYSVQVSTSTKHQFPSVSFIDTPGLVDGDVKYRFPPEKVIARLAAVADLIICCMDPHSGSQCNRTMNVVADLNKRGYQSKMQFLLTKADTVESLQDLNKLIVQLTQRFTAQLSDTHAISVPAVWIPAADRKGIMDDSDNALPSVLDMIGKAIQKRVQLSMERLKEDADMIVANVDKSLKRNKENMALHASVSANLSSLTALFVLFALAMTADAVLSLWGAGWMPAALTEVPSVKSGMEPMLTAHQSFSNAAGGIGMGSWLPRCLALAGMLTLVSLCCRVCSWRLSGVKVRSEPEVAALQRYRKSAHLMLLQHDTVSQAYVDAAKAPEFTKSVMKRRGAKPTMGLTPVKGK